MARKKFQLVLQYILFDGKATRTQQRGTDTFPALKEL